jgi:hypothetical protein
VAFATCYRKNGLSLGLFHLIDTLGTFRQRDHALCLIA